MTFYATKVTGGMVTFSRWKATKVCHLINMADKSIYVIPDLKRLLFTLFIPYHLNDTCMYLWCGYQIRWSCNLFFERGYPTTPLPCRIFEFNAPLCLGEICHYFNQCDLFCSFYAIIEVQFGGLTQLDAAVNNYKDNLNFLPPCAQKHHCVCACTLHWHMGDAWGLHGAPKQSWCIVCSHSPCI